MYKRQLSAPAFAVPAMADDAALRSIVAKFATIKNFQETEAVVRELAASGDPVVERPLLAPVSYTHLELPTSDLV